MGKTTSGKGRGRFSRFALASSVFEHVIFCFLRVVFLKCSSKSYIVPDDGRAYAFSWSKSGVLAGASAFLPEFVCFKRAIKANKWSDRMLKHESIMAALTFLHVIMVYKSIKRKFAAAFSMRSRIFDAFRRIWKYNARFFTLHLSLLRGILRVRIPYFCHDFAQNKGERARYLHGILKR